MFTGEYRHSVDAKGRVAIPARFRLQLEEGAVVVRWVDGCAAIFPRPAFEALAVEGSPSLPLANEKARPSRASCSRARSKSSATARAASSCPAAIREWAGLDDRRRLRRGSGTASRSGRPDRWAASQEGVDTPEALASASSTASGSR